MRLPGRERLRYWAERAVFPFCPGGVILLYHRVCELSSDPQRLCVSPKHFAEHLEYLRGHGCVISLSALAEKLEAKVLPGRFVAVTFDDGYSDNLYEAKPLLERYRTPATVFVTGGCVRQEREFWWDELDRLLLQPGRLPETLQLNIGGNLFRLALGKAAHYTGEDYCRCRGWNMEERHDPSAHQSIYRALCKLLGPLPESERRKALDGLLAWAGAEPAIRASHRVLSGKEALQMEEGGLVEVGAHAMTHPVLSSLPSAAQRSEILRSKTLLEDILGRRVQAFSYPYGSHSDYTGETVSMVREAGFVCACSNFAGFVGRGTELFQLPRLLVRDWDGGEFASRLGKWFDG